MASGNAASNSSGKAAVGRSVAPEYARKSFLSRSAVGDARRAAASASRNADASPGAAASTCGCGLGETAFDDFRGWRRRPEGARPLGSTDLGRASTVLTDSCSVWHAEHRFD